VPESSKERSRKKDAARTLKDLELVFDALAHAQRRHILLVLHYRGGEMLAGDIAGRFACSWPTTTRHLGVLLDAGLVEVRQDGRHRTYRLNAARLQSVVGDWLGHFTPPKAPKSKRRSKT
tara:strand:- start:10474 stop:10833 length:360 start_codon:yes stop_codon:yes gene_type:complete